MYQQQSLSRFWFWLQSSTGVARRLLAFRIMRIKRSRRGFHSEVEKLRFEQGVRSQRSHFKHNFPL